MTLGVSVCGWHRTAIARLPLVGDLYPYPYLIRGASIWGRFDIALPLFKTHFFFTVPTNSKYKTVGDIIADAKANPGKLNYGSWSVGNPVHLGSELFESMTGTQMEHVIYKETTQLYTSVATGELAFALGSAATSVSRLVIHGASTRCSSPDLSKGAIRSMGWLLMPAPAMVARINVSVWLALTTAGTSTSSERSS